MEFRTNLWLNSCCMLKKILRKTHLSLRKGQNQALKITKDKKIVQKIAALPTFKKAKNILFYLPIHGEVDLSGLFDKFQQKKNFALARIKGKTLQLHKIKNLDHTSKNRYKIPEPHEHLTKIDPKKIELWLIPGLVFDKNGNRIGYGKGFFDRLLPKTKGVKIGIAYEFQIVKNIPGETHDIPMDMIVTEKRSLKVRRQGA